MGSRSFPGGGRAPSTSCPYIASVLIVSTLFEKTLVRFRAGTKNRCATSRRRRARPAGGTPRRAAPGAYASAPSRGRTPTHRAGAAPPSPGWTAEPRAFGRGPSAGLHRRLEAAGHALGQAV